MLREMFRLTRSLLQAKTGQALVSTFEMNDTQMTQLRNAKMMLDEGIFSQDEFDKKKKAILAGSENESLIASPPLAIVDQMPERVVVAPLEAAPAPTLVQPGVSSVNNLNNENNINVQVVAGGGDDTVAHGCHFALCLLTGGFWLPCWVAGCAGCCCEQPCN